MISIHILTPILTESHTHFATAFNASIDTDSLSLVQAVYRPLHASIDAILQCICH